MASKLSIGVQYADWKPHCMKPYIEYASNFGVPTLIMPHERKKVDLLILIGGPDLSPMDSAFAWRHSLPPSTRMSRPSPEHLQFYEMHLHWYIDQRIPVFGICLGFQKLASVFGSQLYPHIDGHRLPEGSLHPVVIYSEHLNNHARNKLYKEEKGYGMFSVSSYHHHAVKRLGEELIPISWSLSESREKFYKTYPALPTRNPDVSFPKEFQFVEAFMHHELPIAGVQWHPEIMENIVGKYIHRNFGYRIGDPIANSLVEYLLKREDPAYVKR